MLRYGRPVRADLGMRTSRPERISSSMIVMYRLLRAIPLHFFSFFSHPDSGKEINCRFVINPSADFGSVGSIQLPDLIFDLFDIGDPCYIYHN